MVTDPHPKVREGRSLLEYIRRLKELTVDLAFWTDTYDPSAARLHLLFKELPTLGPTAVNRRLHSALRQSGANDLTMSDIYLAERDDPIVLGLQPMLNVAKYHDTHFIGVGGQDSAVFVYALKPRPSTSKKATKASGKGKS